jgi:hypothetical protein
MLSLIKTNAYYRDFQKLIFYYYADHYINFKDLITELYRIYKTRIWLSAINPASFSQHALGQPPSGIGPGAVVNQDVSNNYSMMYGADPDPYGAVPPYRIGYETYTPNYPAIPGVANSFAPNMAMTGAYPPYASGNGDPTPTVPPGVTPTGTASDYNFYYERNGSNEHNQPGGFGANNPFFSPSAAPSTNFYARLNADVRNALPSPGEGRQFGYNYLPAPPAQPAVGPVGSGVIPKYQPFTYPGPRPESSGTAPQGPTYGASRGSSNTTTNAPNSFSALMSRHLGNNSTPDFVPGNQPTATNQPPIGWSNNETRDGRNAVLSYLHGLQSTDDVRGEEATRER